MTMILVHALVEPYDLRY